jgi:hypothetical protein
MAIALLNYGINSPDWMVGVVAVMLLGCGAIFAFARWLVQGPVRPDPWDGQVAAELDSEDAVPLCHHCLTQHHPSADFCPACGAAVGQYTNWLPFPYLFSVGQGLRLGTAGDFKRSPFTVFGYLLLGLAEYLWFAPVYWVVFLVNLPRRRSVTGQTPALPESPT